METQFMIAYELVNDYWRGENFWDWIGNGPMYDADEEFKQTGDIIEYIDHLDRCISCIVDNDEDQYSAEELEFLNSVEGKYKVVDLKFDYTFMNALYDYLVKWSDDETLLKKLKEQLAVAKLCGVEETA
tara:strand:- start:33 stop:419 length:387 start_codon:yes stop_codon:yes gene_type:complete